MNSFIAHNKISLLAAYISTQKYDIICISETYLDYSVPDVIDGLSLEDYNLVRGNIKSGGVCIYRKEDLALRAQDVSYSPECQLYEVFIQCQRGCTVATCCFVGHSSLEFRNYLFKCERLLEHSNRFLYNNCWRFQC